MYSVRQGLTVLSQNCYGTFQNDLVVNAFTSITLGDVRPIIRNHYAVTP